ncbi:MAG: prohibitin family protein [Exilispira sp.]|jgi:regulator of protease activity HflC (stomatin/prohibitin superfamily)|nr:prohibitin family protein [Exilispira sp.]
MGGIFGILFLILGIIYLVILQSRKAVKMTSDSIKFQRIAAFIIILVAIVIIIFSAITTINAGEVGIMVIFGKTLDKQLGSGLNIKNIFADVVKFPVRLQEFTMSIATEEGERYGDDSISALTKDQLMVKIDCTIWWVPDRNNIPKIYKEIAKSIYNLKDSVVRPAIRTALRDITAKYTFVELIEKRDQYSNDIHKLMESLVGNKYVFIDKVLVRNILPPESILKSIEEKLAAQQALEQKIFELEKAKKDAEIQKVQAQGIAEAQNIIQQKLTPLYVQYKAIEMYEKLANSPNTTFIILPTSTSGAGIPLILNAPK